MALPKELRDEIADRTIRAVVPVGFFGIVVIGIGVILFGGQQYHRLITLTVAMAFIIPGWIFAIKNKPVTGILFLLSCICLSVIAGMAVSGGIRAPAYTFTLIAITVITILYGAKGGMAFIIFTVVIGGLFYMLNRNGIIHRVDEPTTAWLFLYHTILLTMQFFFVLIPVRLLFKALLDSQRQSKKLQKAIIEREQGERALGESEEKYRNLFSTSRDGIMVIDAENSMIIDVNDACEKIYGFSKEEFLKMKLTDVSNEPEKTHDVIKQTVDGTLSTIPVRYHKKKNGSIFPIEVTVGAFSLKGKKVVCGIIRDITERMQAEETLRESEERYRQVVENASDAIFIAQDGKIIFTNKRTSEILGYENQELRDTPFLKFIHPDDQKMVVERHFQRLKGDKDIPSTYSFRVVDKNGSELTVQLSAILVKWEDRPATLSFIRDITEQKRLEASLSKAQKMEAIGTLAGGIAHDFNNILSAIIGYSELSLSKLDPGASLHGNVSKVLKAGERARDLVQQILTFSRQGEREMTPVQIKPIVKEVIKFIRATLPTSIEIQQNLINNPTVMADTTQVHQIIMNLCTNAGHSMQEKGGILKIGLESLELDSEFMESHPELRPGKYIKMTVSDTGIGIPPDKIDRVFDPYFTTKEKEKGTGLGLATVHGITKSHGGAVTVESQVGKGTKFEVYLPLAVYNSETKKDYESQLIGGSERILLVDDEQDIINIEKEILEELGYTVTVTDSANKALEIFGNQPNQFDLVISDMAMPKMTGDKLAGELIKIRSDIPVLLCTGFSEGMSEGKVASLGAKGFLMKPVTLKTLSHKVRKVLDEKLN